VRDHFNLFTYGTLTSRPSDDGNDAPAPLAGCELVGQATIRGTLYDLGPYPALLLAGTDPVPGQIWRCPASRLPQLDRYEAVSEGLFRRVGVRVADTACWVYVAGPRLATRLTPDSRVHSPPPPPSQ